MAISRCRPFFRRNRRPTHGRAGSQSGRLHDLSRSGGERTKPASAAIYGQRNAMFVSAGLIRRIRRTGGEADPRDRRGAAVDRVLPADRGGDLHVAAEARSCRDLFDHRSLALAAGAAGDILPGSTCRRRLCRVSSKRPGHCRFRSPRFPHRRRHREPSPKAASAAVADDAPRAAADLDLRAAAAARRRGCLRTAAPRR